MRCVVWFLALCGASASAQTPPADCSGAPALLEAPGWRDKAWGAYLAGRCGLAEMGPGIAAELARLAPTAVEARAWESEEFWAVQAMLDAIVALRQPADAGVLVALRPNWPAETLLLLLQTPEANRDRLAGLRRTDLTGADWVAASDALTDLRAPGFARTLLDEVVFSNTIWVTDSGSMTPPGVAGSLLGGVVTVTLPAGFPPLALRYLTCEAQPKDSAVARAPYPVFSHRTVLSPGVKTEWDRRPGGFDYQSLRIGYLATLAKLPFAKAEAAIQARTAVRWTDAPTLEADIARILALQRASIVQLGMNLIGFGVLNSEDFYAQRPQIDVELEDDRTDRSVPLPAASRVEAAFM